MLHRFATYEDAALFVAKKRSDGYYAEVLHEHSSVLWGPLAMTGVAAWVSEEAIEDNEEAPELEARNLSLPTVLSLLVGFIAVGVPVAAIVIFLFALLRHAVHYPLEAGATLLALLLGAGFCVLLLLLFAATAWASSRWVHAIWSRRHRFHEHAIVAHAIVAIITLLLVTEFGVWVLWTLIEFVDSFRAN